MKNGWECNAKAGRTRTIKGIPLIGLAVLALICGAAAISAYWCSKGICLTEYEIQEDLSASIRIVHLTDLHSKVYGDNNQKLVDLVTAQEPDLILMTGDMLSRSDSGPDVVCELIPRLLEIAPVYYGYGNHEKEWEQRTGKKLEPLLTQAGAIVLDCTYVDVTVKGQALRLGGYHGYYRQPHMFSISEEQMQAERAFADEFENTNRVKILLCHIPTPWLDWGYIDQFPVDLVLSGHYHGGQVRLPLIGGLYAPYVGFFPEYTRGIFQGEKATCVLSVGAGTENGLPRINNMPEMVVVEMKPEP